MIAKNTTVISCCMACLNYQGEKKVVNTCFEREEGSNCVVVLFRCQNCGGVTKEVYRSWSSSYISGPQKTIFCGGREEDGN